jgi:hypothetical protein
MWSVLELVYYMAIGAEREACVVAEGRSVIYVARQLGHDARLTLTRYGHVVDELEDAPRIEAEVAIADARRRAGPSEPGGVSEFGRDQG